MANERVVLTIHLPLEMGLFAALLKVIARQYPGAKLDQTTDPTVVKVVVVERA